jgi:hypothetical protein
MANKKAPPHYMDSRLKDTLQAQLNQSLRFPGCMGSGNLIFLSNVLFGSPLAKAIAGCSAVPECNRKTFPSTEGGLLTIVSFVDFKLSSYVNCKLV